MSNYCPHKEDWKLQELKEHKKLWLEWSAVIMHQINFYKDFPFTKLEMILWKFRLGSPIYAKMQAAQPSHSPNKISTDLFEAVFLAVPVDT